MNFYYNQKARDRVEQNGTLLATLPINAKVILRGERDPITQAYKWEIYVPDVQAHPIAPLTCAYSQDVVVSADRRCECGAFCRVVLRKYSTGWELHRDVTMDDLREVDPDVRIVMEDIQESRAESELPLKTDHLDLHIAFLACPRCKVPYFTLNDENIEKKGKCDIHCLYIKVFLVWRDGLVCVEQRAYDYTLDLCHLAQYDKRLSKLACPVCDRPIKSKTLRCLSCQNIIVDVTLKTHTDKRDPRKIIQISVERDLRWVKHSRRPPDVIPIDFSTQQHTITTDAPGWDDSIADDTPPPLSNKALAERERISPTSANRTALRNKVIQVLRHNTYEATEEKFGITRGKLQQLVKEHRALNPNK